MDLPLFHSRAPAQMRLGLLRDISSKQACETATQWRFVLRKRRIPFKEKA
ncbi:hypothetical protein ABID23_000711 [Bartonella silvatica]|uniref:Transposase n=1 Tax=Bartonella silvatica TaxID=357760 RepID=A0ABV2HHG3_9HYPH